jgi:cytochrome c-type biogenesis protein CcmH/NrfF
VELLWTIPVLAVVAGAVVVIIQMRSVSEAATELRSTLHRVDEVRAAVAQVRAEGTNCGGTSARIRARRH